MLKAEMIFITSLKASVTVFLSVSLSVCHRYLQMTNPDKVFGKLWLCVLLIIIETKITVKRQLEMTWACPSILSASGQCWIENLWKLYQFGIQLKDQTHFLSICWQCWYDFYVISFISRKALLMCPQYICNLNLWQRKVFKLLDAKLFSLTYF